MCQSKKSRISLKVMWPLIIFILFIANSSSAYAFTVYTDRAAWQLAAGTVTTIPFDTDVLNDSSIRLSPTGLGAYIASDRMGGTEGFDYNQVMSGRFRGSVASSAQLIWDFLPPIKNITAFGGDFFDINSTGTGLVVTGYFDGPCICSQTPIQFSDYFPSGVDEHGFFGVVSTVPFSSITWATTDSEYFEIDNFSFRVPEPNSFVLSGIGVIVLNLVRRRLRT